MGNETQFIKDAVQKSDGISLTYAIGSNFRTDIAPGCPKDFSAYYRCGDNRIKYIYRGGEAGGKPATFDCKAENKTCTFLLNIQDDGNLVIYSTGDWAANGTVKALWYSNTYNVVGIPDVNKTAAKGKYGRSFMLPGETLEDGEFVGSPSGKCFLTMIKGKGLALMYSKTNCQNIDGKMYGTDEPADGNGDVTAAAYVIPENDLSNLYKTGYVDRGAKLLQYDGSLLTKSNAYTNLGNFRLDGNSMKTIQTTNLDTCKSECNNNTNCDGFAFGKNTCDLRSNPSMFPNVKRYADPDVSLYKRLVNVKNSSSCSKDVIPVSVSQYAAYVQGGPMSENVTCGLGVYNKEYYEKLNTDLSNLQEIINDINTRLNALSTTDKNILAQYGLTKSKLDKDIFSIQEMKNKFPTKPQLETVKGMEINSEDDMMSSSYYNILWSILAIMIVIGGIKMSK